MALRVYADGNKVWALATPGPDGKRLHVFVGKALGLAEARKKADEGAAAMAQKQAAAAVEARKKAEEEAAAERKREQARMEERRLCVSGCPLLLFWCRLLVCL